MDSPRKGWRKIGSFFFNVPKTHYFSILWGILGTFWSRGGEIFQTYRERGERNISDPSLGGRNLRLSIILDSLEAN